MRRQALIGFAAAMAIALVGLLALALTRESRLVYTIGAGPGGAVAELRKDHEVCQGPLAPPASEFDRVVISLGTYFKPGSPVDVVVRPADDPRGVLARGRLAGGYRDIGEVPEHSVPVGATTVREPVSVCVRNTGTRKVAVYGAPGIAHRTSTASLDGKPYNSDVAVRLERGEPRSLLSRLPGAFRHAALFKGTVIGPWAFWALAALALVAVPLLFAFALSRTLRQEAP